ncbi:hypothetical protein [Roseateles sp. P5_E7]
MSTAAQPVFAAEQSSAERLRGLVRLKSMQQYSELVYDMYLRKCARTNPATEQIIPLFERKMRSSGLQLTS